ncbi:MAG: nitroreductase [Flavobacteriales bacterium]|nr:nitroreductase [Flavobacteriales bacterium]
MMMTPEDSLAWIESRRSVFPKEFNGDPVSKEEVHALLEAARWAPTHKVTEPWSFQVFMGEPKNELAKTQIQGLYNAKGKNDDTEMKAKKFTMIADRSSAVIAIVLRRDPLMRVPRYEEEWAVAAAVQNIHLHAHALEIGMYWSTGASKGRPEVDALLGLDEHDLHMGWIYVGRYAGLKTLSKDRKSVEDYVTWK